MPGPSCAGTIREPTGPKEKSETRSQFCTCVHPYLLTGRQPFVTEAALRSVHLFREVVLFTTERQNGAAQDAGGSGALLPAPLGLLVAACQGVSPLVLGATWAALLLWGTYHVLRSG